MGKSIVDRRCILNITTIAKGMLIRKGHEWRNREFAGRRSQIVNDASDLTVTPLVESGVTYPRIFRGGFQKLMARFQLL